MSIELSAASFRPCLNRPFRIVVGDGDAVDTELIEVRALDSHTRREDRTPFSCLFRGPIDVALEQRIYRLENEDLGDLELFLVTVGPDLEGEGMLYEAVFT